jgi:hypothetical protein
MEHGIGPNFLAGSTLPDPELLMDFTSLNPSKSPSFDLPSSAKCDLTRADLGEIKVGLVSGSS